MKTPKTMTVEEFLRQFGIKETIKSQPLGRTYFTIKDEQYLKNRPIYSGEPIAHQRGPVLIPSTTFLQHIGKQARKHIIVNEKAEWLYICGRDIFTKGITSHNNPEVGDKVVVLNKHKECIGYGELIAPLTSAGTVMKRLFDIGDLLRRERKSKKVKF